MDLLLLPPRHVRRQRKTRRIHLLAVGRAHGPKPRDRPQRGAGPEQPGSLRRRGPPQRPRAALELGLLHRPGSAIPKRTPQPAPADPPPRCGVAQPPPPPPPP